MAEFPALPLFTDALIADTEHLTHEEFGAYMRILVLLWRTPDCRMPCADAWLMRKLRSNQQQFNDLLKPLFSEFLVSDGAFYTQKRLSKEFSYVRAKRVKNRGAAKSRWNKEKRPHSGNANPTPPHPILNSSNELFNGELPKQKKFDPIKISLPPWLPSSAWKDWVEHRRSIRKPLGDRAASLCLQQLSDFRTHGHDAIAIINNSIMNGWQGLFEPKPNGTRNGHAKPDYSSEIQTAMAKAMHNVREAENDEIPR